MSQNPGISPAPPGGPGLEPRDTLAPAGLWVQQRVQSRGAPRPHSRRYNSPLTGHERQEPKIYEGEALCAFYLNSHPPGAAGQLPEGILGGPPGRFHFGTLFPLPLGIDPSPASALPSASLQLSGERGDLFPALSVGSVHRRRIVPRAVHLGRARRSKAAPRNNATVLRNHGLWEKRKKEKPTIISISVQISTFYVHIGVSCDIIHTHTLNRRSGGSEGRQR